MPAAVGSQTKEDLRDGILLDLRRSLPEVSPQVLEREITEKLERFGDVSVEQYLPVLVARQVKDQHRAERGRALSR